MKLLVFAHRGEAQAFFNEWNFLPIDFHFNGLFKNNKYFLLITGEGPKEASEKTVATLSCFKNEITEIINIGIAGSLGPQLKVGDTAWVRSSYAQNAERCEFKSFTSKFHTGIDCITAYSRITNQIDRKMLSAFADIVDREFWAIASAAHLFKIDALALKLISDDIESVDMCQLIKDEAPTLSKKLFTTYLQFEEKSEAQKPITQLIIKSDTLKDYLLSHPKFYFTISQSRKLAKILHGLELKQTTTQDEIKTLALNIIDEHAADKNSKELSKILLQELGVKLNPLNAAIKEKIHLALKPLTDAGADISFDPDLEQDYVNVSYQIKNSRDQKRLILSLEQFNYQKIKDIFAGNLGDDV